MKELKRILSDEYGQGLMEYSLILSLVVVVIIGTVKQFGGSVYGLYQTIIDVLNAL